MVEVHHLVTSTKEEATSMVPQRGTIHGRKNVIEVATLVASTGHVVESASTAVARIETASVTAIGIGTMATTAMASVALATTMKAVQGIIAGMAMVEALVVMTAVEAMAGVHQASTSLTGEMEDKLYQGSRLTI